jgi:hypothetical protein
MSNRAKVLLGLVALVSIAAAVFGYWIVSTVLKVPWGVMD